MTIVYSYFTGMEDEPAYFATKAEALKSAQECADYHEVDVLVQKHKVLSGPDRNRVAALLNRSGWCIGEEVIKTVEPRFHLRLKKRDAA